MRKVCLKPKCRLVESILFKEGGTPYNPFSQPQQFHNKFIVLLSRLFIKRPNMRKKVDSGNNNTVAIFFIART